MQRAFRRQLAALDATMLRHPDAPWTVTREGVWRELRWKVESQAAPVPLAEAESAAVVAQACEEMAAAHADGRLLPGHIGARTRAMQDGVSVPNRRSAKKKATKARRKAREAAAGAAEAVAARMPEEVGAATAGAAWRRLARRRSLREAAFLVVWRRVVQRMMRPWWGGSQARLGWRCLVLRLFEPSDDPDYPRVVDDLLEYRGMQRAHEARGDFRGCRDMGAYYDDYDPDRAYLGAIAEPGAWYDNYVNDYADEEDDHEDDYDFGGA